MLAAEKFKFPTASATLSMVPVMRLGKHPCLRMHNPSTNPENPMRQTTKVLWIWAWEGLARVGDESFLRCSNDSLGVLVSLMPSSFSGAMVSEGSRKKEVVVTRVSSSTVAVDDSVLLRGGCDEGISLLSEDNRRLLDEDDDDVPKAAAVGGTRGLWPSLVRAEANRKRLPACGCGDLDRDTCREGGR